MIGRLIETSLGKLMMTLLVIGVAGSTVSYGTFATFTAQVSNTGNTFSTGTLTLSSTPATGTSILTLSNMKPGDSIIRTFTIQNTGSINATYRLSVSTGGATLLSTDTTNGIQLKIDRCSQAWTGTAPAFTCGGTETSNVVSTSIIVSNTSLGTLNSSASEYLRVTVTLPSTAGNTFQNLSETFTFTWDAEQVAGSVS